MREQKGNMWTIDADVRVITTNGIVKSNGAAVMGKGVASQARDKYPDVDFLLGKYLKKYGNRVFVLADDLVSFPVKHNWRNPADLELIKLSAAQLVALTNKKGWEQVVVPLPGCGAGQLRWEDVKPVLEPIFDDRFILVSF